MIPVYRFRKTSHQMHVSASTYIKFIMAFPSEHTTSYRRRCDVKTSHLSQYDVTSRSSARLGHEQEIFDLFSNMNSFLRTVFSGTVRSFRLHGAC